MTQFSPEGAAPSKDAPVRPAAPGDAKVVRRAMRVGGVHDAAESEADRVAAEVVNRLRGRGGRSPVTTPVATGAAVARSAAIGHGPEGGVVDPVVQSTIEGRIGGGTTLPDRHRAPLENAFGADLSAVRIHTDSTADSLNRSLNAKAFTTGRDVFFSRGAYDPDSAQGQHVLAHELTHTLQQGGGVSRIQRLSLYGTDWSKVTTVKITEGSGQGVAILSDGSEPLVVKGKQAWGKEVVAYGNLMQAALASKSGDDDLEDSEWNGAETSEARVATGQEAQDIAAVVEEKGVCGDPERKTDVVADIKQPETIVYGYVPGEDYDKVLERYKEGAKKVTKKSGMFRQKRSLRDGDDTIAQLWNDPGQMQMLGKATAVDILSGNGDRLLRYFNAKNFRIDEKTKSLIMIDNVAKSGEVFLGDKAQFQMTAKDSFQEWTKWGPTINFIEGDDAGIADLAITNMTTGVLASMRAEDRPTVTASLQQQRPQMIQWFVNGLAAGRAGIDDAFKRAERLVNGIPKDDQLTFLANLMVRRNAVKWKRTDYEALYDLSRGVAAAYLGIME